MAYVAPTVRSAGDAVTAADYNIMANDVLDHETRINAGGLVFIKSGTATSAATLSIDTCFSSTYDMYKVLLTGSSTSGQAINLRMRVGGTDATGSNYISQRISLSTSTGTTSRTTTTSLSDVSFASESLGMDLTVTRPAVAESTVFAWNSGGGGFLAILGGGVHQVATVYDGFTLLTASAGLMSVTAYIYGYRKS